MKKAVKPLIIVAIVLFCLVVLVVVLYKIKFPIKKENFDSVGEFIEYGGVSKIDVPESASDLRYFHAKDPFFTSRHIFSFVVNDEEEYDILMENIKDEVFHYPAIYKSEEGWIGYRPGWEPCLDYNVYTEKELIEMKYLEDNYIDMDYKEILSLSRHKFGFLYGYGAKVSDYIDITSFHTAFPIRDWYDNAVDESLEDYTILQYNYYDGSYWAILVDEENRRFVDIGYSTL
ncbi:MAG: hypothetical protein IJ397_02585 [Lachnospiraceae bacterium]|nr:hypothetical protein [Lachnospiraceae bacterium]